MVHVSVKAEEIFQILGFPVTNSMILSWIVMGMFLLIGVAYSRMLSSKRKPAVFYLIHTIILAIYNLIRSVLHERTVLFFPLLGAYFFYILMNNWTGMLPTVGSILIQPLISKESLHTQQQTPLEQTTRQRLESPDEQSGVVRYDLSGAPAQQLEVQETEKEESEHGLIPLLRANTADLNTTFALALITVFMIQYFGLRYQGVGYLKKFFTIAKPFPVMTFVGLLELISELARILSFSFRLFGNVLAGEILITIVAFLLPPVASFVMVPFFTLEIMAGAIQALVFTMLSTVLVGMATSNAHH